MIRKNKLKPRNSIDALKINRLPDHDVLTVSGWAFNENGMPETITLYINGKQQDVKIKTVARPDVDRRYFHQTEGLINSGFRIQMNDCEYISQLEIHSGNTVILSMDKKAIDHIISYDTIVYAIDNETHDKKGNTSVTGWVYSLNHVPVSISVMDRHTKKELTCNIRRIFRNDLYRLGLINKDEKNAGFIISFESSGKNSDIITFSSDKDRAIEAVPYTSTDKRGFGRLIKNINRKNIKKFFKYVRTFGLSKTLKTVFSYSGGYDYDQWFRTHRITPDHLEAQKQVRFACEPVISIIVPAYNTNVDLLKATIDSVEQQSYNRWELCIAFAGDESAPARKLLDEIQEHDQRVKVTFLDKNYGISGNTNKALELANGDFVGLFDHDDLLEPDALYEVVKAINNTEKPVAFYTDEDKYDTKGKTYIDPNMKPDFNLDLLRSHNYITHFFVVKRSVLDETGGFRSEFDGAQDYDMILRVAEKTGSIMHIPKVLYHWRMLPGSTALDPESKKYAYIAGQKAIESHLERSHIRAKVRMQEKPNYGLYEVDYEPVSKPLLSIIIPNYEQRDLLKQCIDSIEEKSTYRNFEIIVAENNSTSQKIKSYYSDVQKQYDNVRIVDLGKMTFNFSRINNLAEKEAKGDLLLFLNNDTELIREDSIANMAGFFERPEVGVVGAKLLYEDDTVQHAGVVIGFGGFAGHINTGIDKDQPGYMMRALLNCDYSAVTGACLMTRRSLFESLGGFDEAFRVSCNDIDYCMKVRRKNLLVVYNAFSIWHHYESKSRGYEDDPEKIRRFEGEIKIFQERYEKELSEGDPYYNPNFNINFGPFQLG